MGSRWLKAACAALALYAAGYTGWNESKKGELQDLISLKDKQHNTEISDLVNEYTKLVDKYNHLQDYVDTQFLTDGKYDFSTKLLNDKQYGEFLKNLEASTEKIIHKGVYEKNGTTSGESALPEGILGDRIEPASRGTGLVLYKDPKTGKAIIVTAGHVAEALPDTFSAGWWSPEVYQKLSEEMYIQKGDVKISLHLLSYNKERDFALLETDGGANLTEMPYKIGNSAELEKGNYLAFVGYPFGENVERPSFGWVNNTTGYDDGGVSEIIGSYTYQILLSNPTVPGDSGSSLFALRDGVPEWVGFIHAGYLSTQGMNCAVHEKDVEMFLKMYLPQEKFR